MPKLTKRIVDAAPTKSAPYFVWCSDLPGFGARIFPSGKRAYYCDYRPAVGARKRMSIGQHGRITVDEARKLAVGILGDVVRGGDPAQERATRRASLTVAELCDRYITAAEAGMILGKGGRSKKVSTLATDRGRIERHIKPLLGSKLVIDLAPADVSRFIRDVASGRTAVDVKTKARGRAIVDGGTGTATRTAGLLGGILSFAVAEGVRPDNPARGVKRPADKKRTRRLSPDEYRALGQALAESDLDPWQAIVGAKLLALTGCRLGEIVGLKWPEVDLTGSCLRLDDSKEGASVRPIGKPVVDLLKTLERPEDYVLPAIRAEEGSYAGMPAALKRIVKRAGLSGVTAHTLRHSFASVAGDLGMSDSTIGALLGHAGGTVTSRYIHRLDAVLIAAADKAADAVVWMLTA